jgi:O-antigen ligase
VVGAMSAFGGLLTTTSLFLYESLVTIPTMVTSSQISWFYLSYFPYLCLVLHSINPTNHRPAVVQRISATKIEDLLISLTIFISSYVFFKQPFEGYFHYIIFLLYLPVFISRYGLPVPILKLLALPTIFSLYYILIGDNTFFSFFKIFMGLLLSGSFYYYVFVHYDYDTVRLFRMFLKGCVVVSFIGIAQGIFFVVGFTPGYHFGWIFNKWGLVRGGLIGIRVNSIFSEPSQLAILISPAVFISIHHILTRNFIFLSWKYCLVILVTLVLSTSSTGYLGVFLSAVIIAINFRRILDALVIGVIATFAIVFLYQNVTEFRTRADSYFNILDEEELKVRDINSSSFVQYNNTQVAVTNFMHNPLFGTGLGSYQSAYEKYSLTKEADFLIKKGFDFNSQDANSLFLRVMAEMGLVGLAFLFLIVFRFFVLKSPDTADQLSWLISGSVLTLILLTYFRQGNYFLNGFPFFMWLYYFNGSNYKNYRKAVLT